MNAEGIEATRHLRHPDVEVFDAPNLPDPGHYVGEAAIREFIADVKELGWDGHWWVQQYIDAGEEVVVVWQMRGRSTHGGGVPFDVTVAHVCLFEGGKLRRIRAYRSKAEALEAAGLRE